MAEEVRSEEKKGGKKKLLIFFLLGLLIIAVSGTGVLLMLGKKGSDGEVKGKKAKKNQQTLFIDFDPIIVNLLDPSGKRYLQIKLSLEVADKKAEQEIKRKEPKIRDRILTILSGKTVEEVIIPDAKEKIKAEILRKLKEDIDEEMIINVYITQFIVE
ncbi:MAG: flagellar basal body-associated FliL family protein [Caldimicrobium sp.]|nr:flagellar basal body-associated FliL family protein [Caldimicrobium sp.]MCX7874094.1 flagellar basal body-associated FliL family protein [Caldimicrobium sp.]MDW8093771.1 flagellar basal body-associated FliL family protein [Caldimicrobium sp.]